MAWLTRATLSASNSPDAPPESRVEAVLERATVALGSAPFVPAGTAWAWLALLASAAAACEPGAATATGLSAGLPIFMVFSIGAGRVRAHQHGRSIGVAGRDFRGIWQRRGRAARAHKLTSIRRSPDGTPV